MRKVFLYLTMTFDGFIAGPNNELDWMLPLTDAALNDDIAALLSAADTGLIGYPTAVGMIPYWADQAKNPSASKGERAIAEAINKIHAIVLSNTEEKPGWENAELLLVRNDGDLREAVARLKNQPGGDIGIPGGVRTAQKFVRLGLVDEYVLLVHPVAIGSGKRLFESRVDLDLVSGRSYGSGIMRVCYRPRYPQRAAPAA